MTGPRPGDVLIFKIDLIVQERRDQTTRRTGRAALLPLIATDRVVAVQGTLAFLVEAAEEGMDVVREEALIVQQVAEPLCAGGRAHGLAVLVAVHLHDGVEPLGQGAPVAAEADD